MNKRQSAVGVVCACLYATEKKAMQTVGETTRQEKFITSCRNDGDDNKACSLVQKSCSVCEMAQHFVATIY